MDRTDLQDVFGERAWRHFAIHDSAGTLKMGKAQQRLFQGGVMTRVSTIQRRPLVLTVRLRLEASGSR